MGDLAPIDWIFLLLFFGGVPLALLILCLTCLYQMRDDLRIMRKLMAAYMEHNVAAHVAQDRLASAVQEANRIPK
jgi:hypothetical protein